MLRTWACSGRSTCRHFLNITKKTGAGFGSRWFTKKKRRTENTTVIECKAEQEPEGAERTRKSPCRTRTRHKPDRKRQPNKTKTTVYIMLTKIQLRPHSIFRFRNKKILHVIKTLVFDLFVRI